MKNLGNKIKSFFNKHFKKKLIECNSCHSYVDAYLDNCPKCKNKLSRDILATKFTNMIFLEDYKELIIFLIGFIGLNLVAVIVSLFVLTFNSDELFANTLINFISYLVTFICMILYLFKDNLKILNSFKNTLSNYKGLIAVLIGSGLIIGFSYLYNVILYACGVTISESGNQSALNMMCKTYPVLSCIFIVFLGPILEELTYRFGLFSILRKRNRYLAYVVTIIFFTFIHFGFDSKDLANECLNIPLYMFPAFTLTYIYERYGINNSIYAHVINNLISFISIMVSNNG